MLDQPPHGFTDFYRSEWTNAVRLAALITQRPSVAEDLAQDAFSQLLQRWDVVSNPTTYLRSTVVNASLKWHRHTRVHSAKSHLLAQPDSVEFAGNELADAVASLPPRQRTVLVLRYYADLSEAEIAEALGCRPGTVKSLASRALARLKKEI